MSNEFIVKSVVEHFDNILKQHIYGKNKQQDNIW